MKFLSAKGLVLGGALLSFAMPSHAIILKQKWQPGQKLTYALDLDGTANVQLPSGAGGMDFLAGVPLEVQMRGKGTAAMNTLKVDEFGTGTLAVTVPKMQLDAQTLGQKVQLILTDGKSQLSFNGQPVNLGALPQGDGKPTTAVKISADGRFKGIEPIGKPAAAPKPVEPAATTPAGAVDQASLIYTTVLNTLPALWPSKDVNVGDTWQANVDFAPLARPVKEGETAKPLGKFDLVLEGEDEVNGKKYQRVTLKGDIDLDGKTLETAFPQVKDAAVPAPAPAPARNGAKAPAQAQAIPQLDHANQSLEGTLWFDADAGIISKAELMVGGRAQAISPTPKGSTKPGAKSWFDFTGTLNMALQSNK